MDVPFHLAGPAQEAPEFVAFASHKFPKFQEANLGHLDASVGLDAPQKIGTSPRGEVMTLGRVPEEAEFVEHLDNHNHKGH